MPDEDLHLTVANALTNLSLALLTEHTLKADLERLVTLATKIANSCSGASITALIDGEPTSAAVSDRVAFEVDLVQYDNNEGPCLLALNGGVVRVGFVPKDDRFPHFAIGAADRRVMSVLSTPIIDHGVVLGTLNMYSQQPDGFDADAERIAAVLAAEAAAGVVKSAFLTNGRLTRDTLQERHDEQTLVARAQGVMMQIQSCNAAQAVTLIHNAAREQGESLVRTAERILSTVDADTPDRAQ